MKYIPIFTRCKRKTCDHLTSISAFLPDTLKFHDKELKVTSSQTNLDYEAFYLIQGPIHLLQRARELSI